MIPILKRALVTAGMRVIYLLIVSTTIVWKPIYYYLEIRGS